MAGGQGQGLGEAALLPQGTDPSHVICFPKPTGEEYPCSCSCCPMQAPEAHGMGTFLRGHLGTTSSAGLCQEIHPPGCLCQVPSSNSQQPTFSYQCPLPGPRELGWSHLLVPPPPTLPIDPSQCLRAGKSYSCLGVLLEKPLLQADPSTHSSWPWSSQPTGLSQGLEGEEGIVAVLEQAWHGLLPSSQWWPV